MNQRAAEIVAPLRYRDFRLIWLAQAASEIGDWAARFALAVLVLQRTGNAGLSALVTAVSILPWVGIGQVFATWGDRLPRRTVMVGTDLIRCVLFAAMAIPQPTASLLGLAFVAGCATVPFEATRSARLPSTVPVAKYGDALTLSHLTYQLAIMAGYLGGGGMVSWVGARGALLLNAVTFLGSAGLVALLSPEPERQGSKTSPSVRAGFQALFGDPYVRRAMGWFSLVSACGIAVESLAVAYGLEQLETSPSTAALVAVAVPIGTFAAGALVRTGSDPARLVRQAPIVGIVGGGVAFAGFAADPDLPLALVPFLGIGVLFASGIAVNAVAGLRFPDELRASAFGVVMGVLQGTAALGAGAAALLANNSGPAVACTSAAAIALALSLWATLRPLPETPMPLRRAAPATGRQ